MLIAKIDGKFGGTITFIGEENGIGRLRFFFVEPFTRGKGVGRLVFTTAMSMAKEMGYKKVITYILASENGASLKASNFICEGEAGGTHWTGKRNRGQGIN